MKKHWSIAVGIIVLIGMMWMYALGWRIRINSEFTSLLNTRPYYRAWTVSYSDGLEPLPNGQWKNHWRAPQFRHVDLAQFKRAQTNSIITGAGPILTLTNEPAAEEPDPIEIFIGPGKELRVTFRNMSKPDLNSLVSSLFAREDNRARTNFEAVFGQSSNLTLVLTTKHSTGPTN